MSDTVNTPSTVNTIPNTDKRTRDLSRDAYIKAGKKAQATVMPLPGVTLVLAPVFVKAATKGEDTAVTERMTMTMYGPLLAGRNIPDEWYSDNENESPTWRCCSLTSNDKALSLCKAVLASIGCNTGDMFEEAELRAEMAREEAELRRLQSEAKARRERLAAINASRMQAAAQPAAPAVQEVKPAAKPEMKPAHARG